MSDSKPRRVTVSPAPGEPVVSRRCPPERQRGARAAGPKGPPEGKIPPEKVPRSTWFPIIVRVGSIGLTLLGLAGIGLAAGQTELPGIVRMASAALDSSRAGTGGEVWLAPAPAAPAAAPATGPTPRGAAGRPDAAPTPPAPCDPAPPPHPASTAGATSTASAGLTNDSKVVLNQAGVAELTRLPSVGAKRAEAIIALRQRLGGFRRPSDLLRVRGIGTRTLARMLPHLIVDAPSNDSKAPATSAGP